MMMWMDIMKQFLVEAVALAIEESAATGKSVTVIPNRGEAPPSCHVREGPQ